MSTGFDTETFLIEPGWLAPKMVCLAIATDEGAWLYHANPHFWDAGPLGPDKGRPAWVTRDAFIWLLTQDPVYGLNSAYDFCVCLSDYPDLFGKAFDAFDGGGMIDVGLSQQLIDNAHGELKFRKVTQGYSLNALERRHLDQNRAAQKYGADSWRLRYAELYEVPLCDWPAEAVKYALEDAIGAKAIGDKQWDSDDCEFMFDSPAQARSAFSLQLLMCWGVMTDSDRINLLDVHSKRKYWGLSLDLIQEGLVRGGSENIRANLRLSRDTKEAKERMVKVCKEQDIPVKLTDTGYKKYFNLLEELKIPKEKWNNYPPGALMSASEMLKYTSVDEDACKGSGDDYLIAYSLRSQLHSVLNTHVPDLLKGTVTPIQPRYTTMVDSGRTACAKSRSENGRKGFSPTNGFQFQNPKRAFMWTPPGKTQSEPLFPPGVGIRECFVARKGMLFADDDYSGLELHTGAQACLNTVGYSKLAEALNAQIDPHLDFAASMMGISYEEALSRKHEKEVKHSRQLAKIGNFGLPGGLGLHGTIGFARGYGVKMTEDEARTLIANWFNKYPEWRDYFRWIRDRLDKVTQLGDFVQLYVGRQRGKCRYTEACNTLFQGLGADVAKNGLYEVAKHCYVSMPGSMLYGARPVGFIHDEILAEVHEELAHEQAFEIADIMVREGNRLLPDVPVRCVPALSKRWCKDAEAVFDKAGRLQPYDLAREGRWDVYYDAEANVKVKWA